MKNFFKKFKSYGFWVSLSSALVLLINALGKAFGFEIENKIIEDVVMSVAGVLVVFGIVSMNKNKADNSTLDDQLSNDKNESDENKDVDVDNEADLDKK